MDSFGKKVVLELGQVSEETINWYFKFIGRVLSVDIFWSSMKLSSEPVNSS